MSAAKNILLVEDDEHDQIFFVRAIRKIENVVLQDVAFNGLEALEKLETLNPLPDLVFMDIDMPLMDGVKCLEEITKKPNLKSIVVVMLSNSTDNAELTRTLGAKAFIRKPSDPSTLHTKLREIIHLDFSVANDIADQSFATAFARL